jgi:hypothetical protein
MSLDLSRNQHGNRNDLFIVGNFRRMQWPVSRKRRKNSLLRFRRSSRFTQRISHNQQDRQHAEFRNFFAPGLSSELRWRPAEIRTDRIAAVCRPDRGACRFSDLPPDPTQVGWQWPLKVRSQLSITAARRQMDIGLGTGPLSLPDLTRFCVLLQISNESSQSFALHRAFRPRIKKPGCNRNRVFRFRR